MEVENTLAKNITAAGDKAAYDTACKRLLANKVILAWIMKSCLEEYRDFEVNEIAEKYIEGEPQIANLGMCKSTKVSGKYNYPICNPRRKFDWRSIREERKL